MKHLYKQRVSSPNTRYSSLVTRHSRQPKTFSIQILCTQRSTTFRNAYRCSILSLHLICNDNKMKSVDRPNEFPYKCASECWRKSWLKLWQSMISFSWWCCFCIQSNRISSDIMHIVHGTWGFHTWLVFSCLFACFIKHDRIMIELREIYGQRFDNNWIFFYYSFR